MPSYTRVSGRMLGVSVAKKVLRGPEVNALVGKVIPAGMPEHVRMHTSELGPLARLLDDVVHRLTRQRLAAFGDEQPGQLVVPAREITLDGPELVPSNGLLRAERIFDTFDPQTRLPEVQRLKPQRDGFRDA